MYRNMMMSILTLLVLSCNSGTDTTGNESINPSVSSIRLSTEEKETYRRAIQPMYQSLLLNTGFSGGILVAKSGEIVFEDYQGVYNRKTRELIDSQSTFHLASITKTFTATAILLLNHRSGLPKYEYFMNETGYRLVRSKNKRGKWYTRKVYYADPNRFKGLATNRDVVDYMMRYKVPVTYAPDSRYQYCNTNYVLLAMVIEKVTGRTYPEYLKDSLFTPLGMQNSFVFSSRDTASYVPSYDYRNSPYPLGTFDVVYGDKNVYSTVRDLFKWNEALKSGKFVSLATLENLAYQPYSKETRGNRNYGLGWHLYLPTDAPPVIYHNGWWHGNNTVFKRLIAEDAVVIVLGNKFNRNIWAAGKMSGIFTGIADTTVLEN